MAVMLYRHESQRLTCDDRAVRRDQLDIALRGNRPFGVVLGCHSTGQEELAVFPRDSRLYSAAVHTVSLQPVDSLGNEVARGRRGGNPTTGKEKAKR